MISIDGFGVALVTPFNEDGSIDYDSLDQLLTYLINHTDFLVVCGTTGETPTLTKKEKFSLLKFVTRHTKNKVPIVFGVGGNNTNEVVEEVLETNKIKEVDAILCVTPYYNKPNQKGLFAHFSKIAENSIKPIILYNVPSRTGCNLDYSTIVSLASSYKNIFAIKEASLDFKQINSLFVNRPKDFKIFSGDDALTLPIMAMGGDGVISVAGNAIPDLMKNLVNSCKENNLKKASEINKKLLRFFGLIFEEGSPAGIKNALWHLGLIKNELRLPLVQVSPSLSSKIRQELEKLEILRKSS
ncbi:MAG: 4-hydroxy-tetrahydrodipicolinate synthase [Bacteroidales bacterium]|nr:4-hydroxy-tetrahydrodipicolinate synthase [Bacteroidales bacterium]